jgi:hypothetical protein
MATDPALALERIVPAHQPLLAPASGGLAVTPKRRSTSDGVIPFSNKRNAFNRRFWRAD